jgi:hypothetical protein
LCNIVIELAKFMEKATRGTYLEMLRVVKFVIDTKNFCLQIQPELKWKNWSLWAFCDSDWAGNSETRFSITGFILYFMNVPDCWQYKSRKGVTLLSSDAEYVAMSDVRSGKRSQINLLLTSWYQHWSKFANFSKTDNVGAILM